MHGTAAVAGIGESPTSGSRRRQFSSPASQSTRRRGRGARIADIDGFVSPDQRNTQYARTPWARELRWTGTLGGGGNSMAAAVDRGRRGECGYASRRLPGPRAGQFGRCGQAGGCGGGGAPAAGPLAWNAYGILTPRTSAPAPARFMCDYGISQEALCGSRWPATPMRSVRARCAGQPLARGITRRAGS
jgi:hypothetical protein